MKSFSKILFVSAAILALLSCSKENPQDEDDSAMPTPELVDLGLSVKWASCNLGASKPEQYGSLFQWAGTRDETSSGKNLGWDNCPYHNGPSSLRGWTKYVRSSWASYWSGKGSPDNKTVLDPEDDAAHVKLGGFWRMPTNAEFRELIDNCTSEWMTLNGVNGRKFTSKKNGNSIFLPAAGSRYRHYPVHESGSAGYYWSSSLCESPSSANDMHIKSGGADENNEYRYTACSIRPVSK